MTSLHIDVELPDHIAEKFQSLSESEMQEILTQAASRIDEVRLQAKQKTLEALKKFPRVAMKSGKTSTEILRETRARDNS